MGCFICLLTFYCEFTVNRILYFAKMTWPWTNIQVYTLMTEIQAQFTGQRGKLCLFWQQTQSHIQAARDCRSRVPQGSCIREPTQRPKGASAEVVAMEEATESCWAGEQSGREGLVQWKYAGLEEGFVFKHLILICFTQQTEILSFFQDFHFSSRDWKLHWWLWYMNLPGKVGQFSLDFWPQTLVRETRYTRTNTCMY